MIPLPKDFVNHFFLHSGIFVILVIVFVTLIVDFCVSSRLKFFFMLLCFLLWFKVLFVRLLSCPNCCLQK